MNININMFHVMDADFIKKSETVDLNRHSMSYKKIFCSVE